MFKKIVPVALASSALLAAAPAMAATFDFTNRAPAYQTVDGISVLVSAWSTSTIAASSLPEAATLGQYNPGFGVLSGTDSPSTNEHTIDNDGRYDFVALYFSKSVQLTAMTLKAFGLNGGVPDSDAWVSYASRPSAAISIPDLWPTLYKNGFDADDGVLPSTAGDYGNLWVISAARTLRDRDDGFKLAAVTVNAASAVPEPASWAMMIVGIGVAGAGLRRRKAMVRTSVAYF